MSFSTEFTAKELLRYSKQIALPNIGESGQKRLKSAKILLIGVGGLGSPAALYLAAAGVGQLGLIEFDTVDESNLQRQIIYSTSDVNKLKVEAAKKRLTDINPHIKVKIFNQKAHPENLREILPDFDLVLDGSDNFSTRFILNDACYFANKPLLSASIQGFSGQMSLFNYAQGPCLRCLYPSQPPSDYFPNCSEAGVLGPVAGVMGTLLASEALKFALGLLPPDGYVLNYDALNLKFSKIKLNKSESCSLCSPNANHRLLFEQGNIVQQADERSCIGEFIEEAIDAEKLAKNIKDFLLIDVREDRERALGEITPSIHLPLNKIENLEAAGFKDLFQINKPIVLYCQTDLRSKKALVLFKEARLKQKNHQKGFYLKGGYLAWLKYQSL
ncbi:MAG: HesA/MoeB/ThiF family protein [Oligoflexales bacterium]|nr:HesA/MoeB/ThiF family protein [Oligoflexales bacterium]